MSERDSGDKTFGQHLLTWAGQRELYGNTQGLRPREVRREGVRYIGRGMKVAMLASLALATIHEVSAPQDGLVAPVIEHVLPGDAADEGLDFVEAVVSGRLDHTGEPHGDGPDDPWMNKDPLQDGLDEGLSESEVDYGVQQYGFPLSD